MPKKDRPKPALTDDDYLTMAESPGGCHADTVEALAACLRLVDAGKVHQGRYKNVSGNPVFYEGPPARLEFKPSDRIAGEQADDDVVGP